MKEEMDERLPGDYEIQRMQGRSIDRPCSYAQAAARFHESTPYPLMNIFPAICRTNPLNSSPSRLTRTSLEPIPVASQIVST